MADKIFIRDLLLRGIVGINPDERVKAQDIVVNMTLFADFTKACQTDNIEDAINYRTITKQVIEIVEQSSYFLIERLVDHIACHILKNFE